MAFRWTAEEGVVALPTLPDAIASGAFGISARGDVIVGFSVFADRREATLWNREGPVGLGGLPDGVLSVALKTSSNGSVVVGSAGPCLGCLRARAFIWRAGHGIADLRDVLVAQGLGSVLMGWTLVEANAVADNGDAVSGVAINPDGSAEAFLARLCPSFP